MQEFKAKSGRRKEILNAAKTVFLEKGFDKTTMEEIIANTSLSKGGVYYHYSNTTDILHDLMLEGILYRIQIIRDSKRYAEVWDCETLAEMLVDKMLDESELMSVYVIFLQASQRNKELKELFIQLKEENRKAMYAAFGASNAELSTRLYSDFMLAFMNAIMLGAEVLSARETLCRNRSILKSMILLALNSVEEASKE